MGERLQLPEDAALLASGTMGAPSDPDVNGRSWSWVLGTEGAFELPVGRPVSGQLSITARAARFFSAPIEVTAWIGERVLGTLPLGHKAEDLVFDLSSAALPHAGRVMVHLEASASGRPADHFEGSTDGRELSFQIAGASILVEGERFPEPPERKRHLLEPGEVAIARLLVAEDTTLSWPLSSDSPGDLWVGLHDMETGQVVSWRKVTLGTEPFDIAPDLEGLAGRLVELSLQWTGSEPLLLGEPKYHPGGPGTNIVLIVIDTLRADHTFGEIPGLETPNLARLRTDGVVFDQTFSHAPMTLPSHTSLFSSRYPQVSGVTNNGQTVPEDLPLLAEWLSSAGYSAYASISLGTLWSPLPGTLLARGFSKYIAEPEIEHAESANKKILPLLEEAASNQPFFLFAHYSDPHAPYNTARFPERLARVELPGRDPFDVPVGTWSREVYSLELEPGEHRVRVSAERGLYLRRAVPKLGGTNTKLEVRFDEGGLRKKAPEHVVAFEVPGRSTRTIDLELWIYDALDIKEAPGHYKEEVASADRAVGRVLAQLDALDLYDSSLIIFTSDHGESLLEHGHLGHARNLYDSEIHVPLVIKPPKNDVREKDLLRQSNTVVRHIDVVPTLLDLLELDSLPGSMGTSLLSAQDRRHFAETHQPESPEDLYALRDDRYKLIYASAAKRFELYDIVADPNELTNLWSERGTEFDEWSAELELLSAGHVSGSIDDMDEETRERLRSLGYLPDE